MIPNWLLLKVVGLIVKRKFDMNLHVEHFTE